MEENQAIELQEVETKTNNYKNEFKISLGVIIFLLVLIVINQFVFLTSAEVIRSSVKTQVSSNELVLKEIKSTQEKQDLIEKEFVVLYDFISRMNSTTNIIEDNIQRIYHYVVPHKHNLSNGVCPECFELRKKQKKHEEPVTAEELIKE